MHNERTKKEQPAHVRQQPAQALPRQGPTRVRRILNPVSGCDENDDSHDDSDNPADVKQVSAGLLPMSTLCWFAGVSLDSASLMRASVLW